MDKFGIFNLLNSFFPLTSQKNTEGTNNGSVSSELISNLLSSFTKNTNTPKGQENKKENSIVSPPHPLQEQMLLTVSNHDAFVNRVKKGQKTF